MGRSLYQPSARSVFRLFEPFIPGKDQATPVEPTHPINCTTENRVGRSYAYTEVRLMRWVTIKKLAELTGYSEDAIRAKKKKGVWLEDAHWRKAPDGRIVFNVEAIQRWLSGIAA